MNDRIKAVIVDDEKLARKLIKNYLNNRDDIELLSECENGLDAIKIINEHKPDLIFLDIQMPKISGFEMLELIDDPPLIIFTTAFDQYALKAFEVNATDYLLKPFSEERFNEAVDKVVKLIKDNVVGSEKINNLLNHISNTVEFLDRIIVKKNQKIVILAVEKINYFEAQDDYVMLFTDEGKLIKQKTMKYFEEHLNPKDFVRIHRSYIARINFIKQIEPFSKDTYVLTLKNSTKLPVSKRGYAKLKEILD